jgi:predicted metalloprotease with PDZ domain
MDCRAVRRNSCIGPNDDASESVGERRSESTRPRAKAGMHTGDTVIVFNGVPMIGVAAFRSAIAGLKVEDTVRAEVGRAGGRATTVLVLPQLIRPVVTIREIDGATERQRRLRAEWAAGH